MPAGGLVTRRVFVVTAAAPSIARAADTRAAPPLIRNLKPMTGGIQPITEGEREARREKARRLMRENRLDGVVCGPGSSMFYFTGRRETTAQTAPLVVLPARGELRWAGPEGLAPTLKDMGAAVGRIGIEERTHFFIVDELHRQLPRAELVSADPVTAGCRTIKSPAEIALMQRANEITIAAYKAAFAAMLEGMTQVDFSANIDAAYRALGVRGGAMAIFGRYTAYPHGSAQPQRLREGDMVLVDDGCEVEGYQSDITRTTVFGKASARQRQIWELERKAQDAAFRAARPGATCESVDAAARQVVIAFGFGPDYKLPGLPHRTGHGIGLDGHEWTYLVRGNKTRLEPGMCFSDEPTVAIPGEFGVRLEDCMYITEDGARMFTKQSPSIDQPFG
jgi:Xaa-Pro dipeptidase